MIKMKKQIPLLMLGIILISLVMVSAQTGDFGTFDKNQEIRLAQFCEDATYINITSITYPNSTIAEINIEMTQDFDGEYYYNYNKTSEIGKYTVRGNSDGCEETFAYYFEIEEPDPEGIFGFNFSDNISIIAVIVLMILAISTYIIGFPQISSLITVVIGFIFLIGNISIVVGTLIIAVGIFLAFKGGAE